MTEYYRDYLAVAVLMAAGLAMVGGMLGVGRLVRPTRPQPEKYITLRGRLGSGRRVGSVERPLLRLSRCSS